MTPQGSFTNRKNINHYLTKQDLICAPHTDQFDKKIKKLQQQNHCLRMINRYYTTIQLAESDSVQNQPVLKQVPVRYEPVHEISNNVVCATSKASDQPAHTCSLIRAFASRLNIL